MSFSKISKLRKAGKLKEAYALAKAGLEANPDDIWAKRAMAWVYYELLKNATERNFADKIIDLLHHINSLGILTEESMFFRTIAWSIAKYINSKENLKETFCNDLSGELVKMPFPKPDTSFTFLLKTLLKKCNAKKYLNDFVKWLSAENFSNDDFRKRELENGRKIISDVEQIYIAAAKIALTDPVDSERIELILPLFSKLTTRHPEMQYPHYYYAKLLLATGDKERFLKAFIPFARRKKRDFWVWDLMSEVFDNNDDRYFSCLCRSLSCGAPVKFSLNVKEKFAAALIKKDMLAEAKREIEDIFECRKKENWRLTPLIQMWLNDKKISVIKATATNSKVYSQFTHRANQLLYYDIPAETVVAEHINNEKKLIRFTASKEKFGTFLFNGFDININPGDVLSVRFLSVTDKDKNQGFFKVATVEHTDIKPSPDIYRIIEGQLKIKQGNSFGFIESVFVPPDIIASHNLKNNDFIKAGALLSYNRKHKSMGMKAVRIY